MKKKLLYTSWLISLVTVIIILFISIASLSNTNKKNAKTTLSNYLSFAISIYDGTNYNQLNNDISKVNKSVKVTIIDFDGNIIFNSNTYNDYSNYLEREEVKNLGNVYIHDSHDRKDILYIAGRDSANYIILAMPMPKIASVINNLITLAILFYILIALISYFIFKRLNKEMILPLKHGINKLSKLIDDESNLNEFDVDLISNKLQFIYKGILEKIDAIIDDKKKIEFVIENLNQGIIVLNSIGNILIINDYALSAFKNPRDNQNYRFVGKHYLYLIQNTELQKQIEDTIENGNTSTFDITIENKIYLVSITPSRNKWTVVKGMRNGVAILILDVTERRNLEYTKRDFFANASHELKSPLTTIIGYQQMIAENMITSPEEIDDAVKRTIKEAKRMDKILIEMLELSRIESKINVHNEDINLKDVILDIVDSYNKEISDRNIKVNLDLEDYIIRINHSHCVQLINNLIDNAIKYNKVNGRIDIKLTDNTLFIKDTGIGIAKSDQNRVFERFYRVDKSRSKNLGGTGLGLAIVKHICSIYAIQISLKSDLDIGTDFKLVFPKQN